MERLDSEQMDQMAKQAFIQGLIPAQLADKSSRESQVVGISSALIAIISITIFLRLYARIFIKRAAGLDDCQYWTKISSVA